MSDRVRAWLPGTEVRTVAARSVSQDYRISVALPASYGASPERHYPTIYLTDANFYFGMVTELTRVMVLSGELPEAIVVGIGYPVDEPLDTAYQTLFRLRGRDLTPVVNPQETREDHPTGGAPAFLAFIVTELIPLIEADYRADPKQRVLAGHSYGGLVTLYALFHQTEHFAGYVVGSPSLSYGDRVTFVYEEQFAVGRTSLPVKIYLGVGGEEERVDDPMVSDYYQLLARLKGRKYQGLSLTHHVVEGLGHCAFTAPTFQKGFQAVLL